MKTITEKKDAKDQIIGFIIGIFLTAAILLWYNHVLYHTRLTYWQWFPLGLVWVWIRAVYKFMDKVMGVVFFVALTVQILSWLGVVRTPIF